LAALSGSQVAWDRPAFAGERDQSFAALAEPFLAVSLDLAGSLDVADPLDVAGSLDVRGPSGPPPEDSEEPVEEGEDAFAGVLDFSSEGAEDFSPDSLLKAFFLASDG
jgi:hypothetical protein